MTGRQRVFRFSALLLAALVLLPLLASGVSVATQEQKHWSATRWDSTGLAPAPDAEPAAVVQVYAARLWGWRGAFAVHTWIVTKAAGADHYTRYEVVRWSSPVLRISRRTPDGHWAGNPPELLRDLRGPQAAALIPQIAALAETYPERGGYTIWPGPNSNSFTAHIARELPELGLQLPPTAIGKDWIGRDRLLAPAPSGTGWQVSLFGLAGVTAAAREGLELNLLGLTIGLDILQPALKLPGLGRIGRPAAVRETAG
ncbi:DUF3750 domain-containing protein [Ferrovibrio sp.]|uniref:DUF3750 domain-containing protein n=1 Tax=Ferrovibrio sp. TaxID=1917215 RepID=UPI003519AC68